VLHLEDNVNRTVFLPRLTLMPSDSGLPFQIKRRQFPIRPAFAMTINKSQGINFISLIIIISFIAIYLTDIF
jgi:hypothetical protein